MVEKDSFFYTGPVAEGQEDIGHPYISHALHIVAHNNALFTFVGVTGALLRMASKRNTSFLSLQLHLREVAGPCIGAGLIISPFRFLVDVNKKNWMVYDVRNNVHHVKKMPDHRHMQYEAFIPFLTAGAFRAAQNCAVTGFVCGAIIATGLHKII